MSWDLWNSLKHKNLRVSIAGALVFLVERADMSDVDGAVVRVKFLALVVWDVL